MKKKIRIIKTARHPFTRAILKPGDTIEVLEATAARMVALGFAEWADSGKEKEKGVHLEKNEFTDMEPSEKAESEGIPKKASKKK